jgi:hypothetical protein
MSWCTSLARCCFDGRIAHQRPVRLGASASDDPSGGRAELGSTDHCRAQTVPDEQHVPVAGDSSEIGGMPAPVGENVP